MIPQRCPVCYGKGIVAANFYLSPGPQWSSTSTAPEKCRSCHGTGVVWPALDDEGERDA